MLLTDFLYGDCEHDKYNAPTTEYQIRASSPTTAPHRQAARGFIEVNPGTTELRVRHLQRIQVTAVNTAAASRCWHAIQSRNQSAG